MAVDDSYSVALLHMDGADTSTTFTDESGKTWTAAGGAQIDTAQSVFGGASGLFDGTGDYITTPDHADFALGSGAFTIDFRVRFNSAIAAISNLVCHETDTNNGFLFFHVGGATMELRLNISSGGATIVQVNKAWTPSINTWYHVAAVRNGNDWLLFIDGTQIGTTVTDTSAEPDFTGVFSVGRRQVTGTSDLNGWMDEVRISKGIARWTGNFTPPTAAYGLASSGFFF